MSTKTIDYTKMRKGTTTHWKQGVPVCRIDYCPECGRKGSMPVDFRRNFYKGKPQLVNADHVVKRVTVQPGMAFDEAVDSCCLHFPFDWLYTAYRTASLIGDIWVNHTPVPSDTEWCA